MDFFYGYIFKFVRNNDENNHIYFITIKFIKKLVFNV